jgi:diguanylate cyclase (GGDEF)-like protein/PAS domain S-box-containing protein
VRRSKGIIEPLGGCFLLFLLQPFLHFNHMWLVAAVLLALAIYKLDPIMKRIAGPEMDQRIGLRAAIDIGGGFACIYLVGAGPMFNAGVIGVIAVLLRDSGSRAYRPVVLATIIGTAAGELLIQLGWVSPHWGHLEPSQWHAFALCMLGIILTCIQLMYSSKRAEEAAEVDLRVSEERHRALVHSASDALAIVDRHGIYTYLSPGTQKVLGYRPDQLVGTPCAQLVLPSDAAAVAELIATVSAQDDSEGRREVRSQLPDGSVRWIEVTVRNHYAHPDIEGLVANYRDVTERRELQERLAHLAYHDPLTELANRAVFSERMASAVAREAPERVEGKPQLARCVLVLIDLDDFKTVNDTLGHHAGDSLLVDVAKALNSVTRGQDVLARLGGDEFALLLDEPVGLGTLHEIGERVSASMERRFELNGQQLPVKASVGVAACTADITDVDELVRRADVALYDAKNSGKGRFSVYTAGMTLAAQERLILHGELVKSLLDGQLRLHYQPVVDMSTGQWKSVEALVRWQRPDGEWVPPRDIMHLVEDSGQLDRVTEWMLREAVGQLAAWRRIEPTLRVSINVTRAQIIGYTFGPTLLECLQQWDMPAGAIVLELNGEMAVDDDLLISRMRGLRATGLIIALNDTGSAPACLGALHQLPVDSIKLDAEFVSQVGLSDHAGSVLTAITALCRSLGVLISAEGVHSRAQQQALVRLGCQYGQGSRFNLPAPPEELLASLPKGELRVPLPRPS